MSYNLENLYDTIDDPGTRDEEFTPGSPKQWNTDKYLKKLEGISTVISSIGKGILPDVIGLEEVENRKVLEDLINQPLLKKAGYGIIHEESADPRGIDIAMIYRKDRFHYEGHFMIPVAFPNDSTAIARDILYVYGKAEDGLDIHFFINHWNSRIGGVKETESKRMYSAVSLRRNLDLLLSRDPRARIVIMGDFNDEPTNRSIMSILLATGKRKNISPGELYNLFFDQHNQGIEGSYNYKGTWNMLDQIILSYSLIAPSSGLGCDYNSGKILKEEWMLYTDSNGIKVPNRTYGGNEYFGGVSDHLPVYVRLELKK
jgi:predicted extracellular nuclease